MMTPTHLLVGAAAFARPGEYQRNRAVLIGALLPDLSIFVLYFWGRAIAGYPARHVWREVYWQEPWQTLGAISNSFPLFLAILAIGWWLKRPVILAFAGAALLHLACDLPLHVLDAHRHFWPISDWRFQSPVSYWDGRFHGRVVRIFEIAFAISLIVLLARRFKGLAVRVLLGAALASYIAVPLYFRLTH